MDLAGDMLWAQFPLLRVYFWLDFRSQVSNFGLGSVAKGIFSANFGHFDLIPPFFLSKWQDLGQILPVLCKIASKVVNSSEERWLIWSKGLRASLKNYHGNTTPSMASSHHWRKVWRNIAGSWPNGAQDFTRTSQKNDNQHSQNFGTS